MIETLLPLAVKMAATALVVVTAAAVAERSGPLLGAMVATLPVSTGPALVILALAQPPDFVANVAFGGFAANPLIALFIGVYAALAVRTSLAVALGGAALAWAAGAIAFAQVPWTFASALAANIVVYAIGIPLTKRFVHVARVAAPARRWFDLPLRAALVATLVGIVTTVSAAIGPVATGIVATYPVSLTGLALILHGRLGGPVVAAIFANGMRAMVGFGGGLATVHLLVAPFGVWGALAAGLAVAVAWNAGLFAADRIRVASRASPSA